MLDASAALRPANGCGRGAFERFDHDHFFEDIGEEKTRCRDVFDFHAPLGLFGRLAERLVLERYMRKFLQTRVDLSKSLAEGEDWQRFLP